MVAEPTGRGGGESKNTTVLKQRPHGPQVKKTLSCWCDCSCCFLSDWPFQEDRALIVCTSNVPKEVAHFLLRLPSWP